MVMVVAMVVVVAAEKVVVPMEDQVMEVDPARVLVLELVEQQVEQEEVEAAVVEKVVVPMEDQVMEVDPERVLV